MRIALFSDTFYPKSDGMSTSTQNLAACLARQGHQVLIVAPKPGRAAPPDFSIPGCDIYWLSSIPSGVYPQLRLASWSPKLHRKLKEFNPEIVHAMAPMPVSLTGISYAYLHHLPVVMTFHTYFMEPEYLKVIKVQTASELIADLGWDLAKSVHARAQITIAPSDFVAQDLKSRHFKEPILTIPSGIDFDKIKINKEKIDKLSTKYELNGHPVVITVGRVSVEKNLRCLLRIFAQVVQKIPAARLVVVGGGPDLAAIKKYALSHHVDSQVVFTGDIPHDQIFAAGYYHLGQIFVTASTSETQGMTAVEAQACGLPVVAYHSKGLPFVVGDAGVLVAEHDEQAMSQALIDPLSHGNKLQHLKQLTQRNIQRFDLNNTTAQMVAAYQQAQTLLAAS